MSFFVSRHIRSVAQIATRPSHTAISRQAVLSDTLPARKTKPLKRNSTHRKKRNKSNGISVLGIDDSVNRDGGQAQKSLRQHREEKNEIVPDKREAKRQRKMQEAAQKGRKGKMPAFKELLDMSVDLDGNGAVSKAQKREMAESKPKLGNLGYLYHDVCVGFEKKIKQTMRAYAKAVHAIENNPKLTLEEKERLIGIENEILGDFHNMISGEFTRRAKIKIAEFRARHPS